MIYLNCAATSYKRPECVITAVSDALRVCVAYSADGKRYTDVPDHMPAFAGAQPIYEELPGWQCDISACRCFEDLPKEARAYIAFLEELAGVKAAFISVGPDREQTIV